MALRNVEATLLRRSPVCDWQSEVRGLDVTQVTQVTLEYRAKVDYLMSATEHNDVLLHLHGLVTHLQDKLPVLEALTDSALRPRHWEEIDAALSQPLPSAFTLAHVDERRLHEHAHTLQQVAHTAQLQREMENRLNQVSPVFRITKERKIEAVKQL
ncbi:uncharacterized protein LOC123519702 [Portunus trituberculatus]|uniref:uncharacterized protein LOC123519702 n=1 Tax=Portunus trituberculatus TaxID=210409 RepID=UPI001E1CF74E|nr:uncharacterized protein LOC123519702 [Portunus trituberculatus]